MTDTAPPDPHIWLEEVTGEQALDWVKARNAETVAELTGSERFETTKARVLEVLDADDRIPYPRRRGEFLYNFWQDAAHPRGLWRRTSLEQYRSGNPDWSVLLDVDALAEQEGENWVWKGSAVLRPDYHLALVELSRGGADATVVREFDLRTLEFVADGFTLPEAKTQVSWIDEDQIYVGTDFGEGSLTTSGYARVVKVWRRGTPLAEAATVFEGKPEDVTVYAYHDRTPGFERDIVGRYPDFFSSEEFLRTTEGDLVRIDVPDDATTDVHREWLLITLRSDWTVAGTTYRSGSLLATGFDAFIAGERELTPLFEPDEHTSLNGFSWTKNHLILVELSDVKTRMEVLTLGPDGWSRADLPGSPDLGSADVIDTDPDHSDEYLLNVSGYLQPATLLRGEVGGELETLKQAPAFFDTTGLTVEQHFATSDDGTRVPYFVVAGPDTSGPTLLYGYGGFEISLTPSYSGGLGRAWLEQGGTYVVANIRGGGEYGPRWHRAALRENRPRAYEDFAAVARDLVTRGITTPARLGMQGGSNGGLLAGVMLTRYPELFGAVVSQVPLLDLRRYHLLLAGASWMAEWGDPDEPADWAYLKEFSPYHNVHSGTKYPPVFFITSTRDDRVHPGHARKMAARMLELGHSPYYYENIEGGHGAAADNAQRAFMSTIVYEFLLRTLS
ncbi:prolyl oligopeptidase family serine peptidase [Actinokineospora sp. NBRC 105648]|uniref:prolyl oligopeptidase family serine peptidase n=1 Tax=Actinokineospora sp. NBRC 105648 TaxID=3032206 RepID=UPI0024A40C1D|nr:prolyl oligopeptidase family serine peptidase [Actinokineospora sp. NBRC 105648]GLZ38673.1 prolyl oligopeptidase [Actinokineospora sp. NBRC 105648]